MNRRTFLRVLGSAAVGVAAAQFLPLPTPAPLVTAAETIPAGGTLTYEMLQHAYESCCIGSEAPNMMICSASFARYYGLVYDIDLDDEVAA